MNVSAKDKATGKEQQIRIQASGGLSDSDIENMIKDAEENADADKKRKELIEAKNQAETMVHQTEKSLEEVGNDVSAEDKEATETALADLKSALESEDLQDIKDKTTALMQASMKIGEAVYRKTQEAQAAEASDVSPEDIQETSSEDSDSNSDDVVDADYTELEVEEDDDAKGKKKSA